MLTWPKQKVNGFLLKLISAGVVSNKLFRRRGPWILIEN